MTNQVISPDSNTPVETAIKQTQDVSARVQELMRKIDRLPAGTYELTIAKPEIRALDWTIDIVRVERIERLQLSKYMAE